MKKYRFKFFDENNVLIAEHEVEFRCYTLPSRGILAYVTKIQFHFPEVKKWSIVDLKPDLWTM